jgi:glycosyltransferase involved in cell wall biosynthesis
MPVFSIITPVFNGADFIEETVRSVLTYASGSDFEYIVVDDGSTDSTSRILESFKNEIRYVRQENKGQASAINKGIEMALGRYSMIVNSDDPLVSPELFRKSHEILDANPEIAGTYPDWVLIDENGKKLEEIKVKEFSLDELVGRFNCLVGPGGVFRTSQAKDIGGWDSNFRFVPDYDFWLKLVAFGEFKRIPESLATWRSHENSISIGSRGLDMSRERVAVIENYLGRNPETPIELRRMAKSNSLYRAAVLNYFDSRIDSRKLIVRSIKAYPRIIIEQNKLITLYLLLTPLSNAAMKIAKRLFRLSNLENRLRLSLKS